MYWTRCATLTVRVHGPAHAALIRLPCRLPTWRMRALHSHRCRWLPSRWQEVAWLTADSIEHAPRQMLRSLNAISPVMPIALLPPIQPETQSVAVQCMLLPTSALTASASAAALQQRAALPIQALTIAPHASRETTDRRWKRKVREEQRVLHTSEVDGLSAVALMAYLRAMGVSVSRTEQRDAARLKAKLCGALEAMPCARAWSYDPKVQGRPRTPCPRRVVDRYLDLCV